LNVKVFLDCFSSYFLIAFDVCKLLIFCTLAWRSGIVARPAAARLAAVAGGNQGPGSWRGETVFGATKIKKKFIQDIP